MQKRSLGHKKKPRFFFGYRRFRKILHRTGSVLKKIHGVHKETLVRMNT